MSLGGAATRRIMRLSFGGATRRETTLMSSARRRMEINDGRGGAEVRCRKVVKIVIRELESRSRAS